MQDPKTTPAAPAGPLDGDAEIDEALSRAAREAVRQPADPRLEKSFARLGLFTDDDPPPPRPARREPAASAAGDSPSPVVGAASPPAVDLEPIRAELVAWRTSAADLARRLEVVTWILFALTGIVGLLAVVLIVRG